MSTLAMILTAAMAVPGDGSEKVSGELVEEKLDLRGQWRGTLYSRPGVIMSVTIEKGYLFF
jgi:hypothetical protein